MSSKLLRRLMDDSALELLLVMAQHVSHVRACRAASRAKWCFRIRSLSLACPASESPVSAGEAPR